MNASPIGRESAMAAIWQALDKKTEKKEKRNMTEQEFTDLVKKVNEHEAVFKIKHGMLVAECRTDDGKHLMRVWNGIRESAS